MARTDKINHRFRSLAGPLMVAVVLAYFGYHAIQGERGILTWLQLSNRIEGTRLALSESRDKESRLERRVALLRRDHLDPDLPDQRPRVVPKPPPPGARCAGGAPGRSHAYRVGARPRVAPRHRERAAGRFTRGRLYRRA